MVRFIRYINPDSDDPTEYLLDLINRHEDGDTVLDIEPPVRQTTAFSTPGGAQYNPTTTIGDVIYCSAAGSPGTLSRLGIGSDNMVFTVTAGGIVEWAFVAAADVTLVDAPDNFIAINVEAAFTELFTGPITFLVTPSTNPEFDYDVANKKYVDDAVGFHFDYFFNDILSDIGGIYFEMTDMDLGGAESSLTKAALGGGDDQAIFNFITLAGEPGIQQLINGIMDVHFHVEKTAGTRSVVIYCELYRRATDTTETLITTSDITPEITSKEEFDLHFVLGADFVLDETDRLVVKFLANLGTGSPTTIVLYQEGDLDSHFTFAVTSTILSNIFVRFDTTDYETLTDGSNADALHVHAGIATQGTETTCVVGLTVIDLGAISDDARDHEVTLQFRTTVVEHILQATDNPKTMTHGTISYFHYKDSGNLKVLVNNDSGVDVEATAFFT